MTPAMERRDHVLNPQSPGVPGFAQSVEVRNPSRTLFIGGQIPVDEDGMVPAVFENQARVAWKRVSAELSLAGMTVRNLVKVTIFLADRSLAGSNRTIRQEVLGDATPALTVVVAAMLDAAWMIEIEAYACA